MTKKIERKLRTIAVALFGTIRLQANADKGRDAILLKSLRPVETTPEAWNALPFIEIDESVSNLESAAVASLFDSAVRKAINLIQDTSWKTEEDLITLLNSGSYVTRITAATEEVISEDAAIEIGHAMMNGIIEVTDEQALEIYSKMPNSKTII